MAFGALRVIHVVRKAIATFADFHVPKDPKTTFMSDASGACVP
jgi:hypothetical protein